MIKKINLLFVTFFKIGKLKFAPGTAASLITCLLFLLLVEIFSIVTLFFFTLFITLYAFIAINNSFDTFDSNDPQEIVIDEVVGQMLPLLAIPIYETLYLLPKEYYCASAFLLFMFEIIVLPSSVENWFFIFLIFGFLHIAIIEGPLPEIVAHNAPDSTKFVII